MISWGEFQAAMPWKVVLLVGGGFALAEGTKVSCEFLINGKEISFESSFLKFPRLSKQSIYNLKRRHLQRVTRQ